MEFFELMDISHNYLEILNPTSREKILAVGDVLNLNADSHVIDFGCGKGELLVLWAEKFGISGTGVDISERFSEKARNTIQERKLDRNVEIVCANGSEYTTDEKYDAGLCIGATFIWGGFRQTIQALKQFVKPDGRLAIGEVYVSNDMPREYIDTHLPETTRHFGKQINGRSCNVHIFHSFLSPFHNNPRHHKDEIISHRPESPMLIIG